MHRQDQKSNEMYYFNFETGESVWDHPCDEHYRKVINISLMHISHDFDSCTKRRRLARNRSGRVVSRLSCCEANGISAAFNSNRCTSCTSKE